METPSKRKPKQRIPWILGTLVLALMTVSILLQSSNYWKVFPIETASDTIVLYALSSLNFIAFIIFGFIFLRSIIKLVRERRTLELGAKIKTRLLIYFVAISLLPIFAMAVFSYLFMNRALERWFTNIPENVIRDARDLQARSITERNAKLQETASMLAKLIGEEEPSTSQLNSLALSGNLSHVEILGNGNQVLAASDRPIPQNLDAELDQTLVLARSENGVVPSLHDARAFDAVVAPLPGSRKLLIVPNYQAEESVSHIADNSLLEFEKLKQQQVSVRQIGLLTLGVLTFLLIFASAWTAFYIARGLTVPIKALAQGADEIARGNLAHRVDVFAEDELALLVSAFNMMTGKLEENSNELELRRRYIETVLQSLPTGVISFDTGHYVSTINRSAREILKISAGIDPVGKPFSELVSKENYSVLERLLIRARRIGSAAEQTTLEAAADDITSADGVPTALIATALPDRSGVVLVIEDLSELIAAQRASAWQEVARRMAHEIKNPLTPIQLSAERIAKKFESEPAIVSSGSVSLPKSTAAGVIREGTDTILREVRSLKAMVDEFSRFARLPNANLEPGSVNEVIEQVLRIYEDRFDDIRIVADISADLPLLMIDAEQLKRVFVNLIENAIESFYESDIGKTIAIETLHDIDLGVVTINLTDNGRGIAPKDFQRLFQPYFSTKGRGTGLGLAIVNRIISDHGGKIKVVANRPRGSKFMIELPVRT